MSIEFTKISSNLSAPGSFGEIVYSPSGTIVAQKPHTLVLVGQSDGLLTTAGKYTVTSDYEVDFGARSQLSAMIRAAKRVAPFKRIEAVVAPVTGAAATKTFAITGTATATSTFRFLAAGRGYNVTVLNGDTATDVGDAIVAAVAEDSTRRVNVTNAAGTLTVTAYEDGLHGNSVWVAFQRVGPSSAAGIVFPASDVLAGGAGSNTNSAITSVVGDEDATTIVLGNTAVADLSGLSNWAADRFGPLLAKDTLFCHVAIGSQSDLETTAAAGWNSQFLFFGAAPLSPLMAPVDEMAAAAGAEQDRVAEDNPHQPILDAGLGLPGPMAQHRFDYLTRDALVKAGLSPLGADASGNLTLVAGNTTRCKNDAGIPDATWQSVRTLRILARIRYEWDAAFWSKNKGAVLVDESKPGYEYPSVRFISQSLAKAQLAPMAESWRSRGLIVSAANLVDKTVFEVPDNDSNRMNAQIPPDLSSFMNVSAFQLAFS